MFTDKFNKAVLTIIRHEGGFCNDPDDPGGATNYGISLRFLLTQPDPTLGDFDGDGDIDAADIAKMTIEDAKKVYFDYWWLKYNYEAIDDLVLATKVFDMSVNMGGKQAHTLLQRAILACGIPVVEDGALGPKCFGAMSSITAAGGGDALLSSLRSEQGGFYRTLICLKPVFEKYRKGWLRRAYEA